MLHIFGKLELIESGHGRKPVCVDKNTFESSERDWNEILPVNGIGIERIVWIGDDGFAKSNKDGTESGQLTLVLVGSLRANGKGEIRHERSETNGDLG